MIAGTHGRRGLRLWLRLTWVMALVATAPVVVLGELAKEGTRENAVFRAEEALNRQAGSLAVFLGAWVDAVGSNLAGWLRVWDLDDRDGAYQVGLLRAIWVAMDPVVSVVLIDADGRPVVPAQYQGPADAPPDRIAGSDARVEEVLAHAPLADADGIAVGEPYHPTSAAPDEAPVVAFRVAVPGRRLQLLAEVSLAPVADPFAPVAGAPSVGLFDARRELVMGDEARLADPRLADELAWVDVVFARDDEADPLRGAVAAVPGSRWVVVTAEPVATAEQASRALSRQTAFTGAVALLVVAALGFVAERLVSRPLRALRDGVGEIARGQYGRRVDADRTDEIGELARAFNDLAAALQRSDAEVRAQRAEIEAFNQELQQRVDERTAELRAAQERLVRAGQYTALAEIGAGLAHELNNPLAAILGTTQVMLARGVGDPTQLARVEAQALRCRDVVDTMVRFAAAPDDDLEAGGIDPGRAPVVDIGPIAALVARQLGDAVDLTPAGLPVRARIEPALAEQLLTRWARLLRGGRVRMVVEALPAAAVAFEGDAPLHLPARDDRGAAGVQIWVARHLVDRVGGRLEEPPGGSGRWRIVLPPG